MNDKKSNFKLFKQVLYNNKEVRKCTDAVALIWANPEARIADAFERPLHVHAFPILAHSARGTFVHVHAERVVSRGSEPRLTNAMIRSWRIFASTVQTDSRIVSTFVDICKCTIGRLIRLQIDYQSLISHTDASVFRGR